MLPSKVRHILCPSLVGYSIVLNRQPCTFISSKVCLLTLIDAERQSLPERNIHDFLFRTLEYSEILTHMNTLNHLNEHS